MMTIEAQMNRDIKKELPLKDSGATRPSTAVDLETSRAGLFTGDDSLAGANFCARATLDAGVGIDVVDVAFRNCVNRANGLASATSHARVSDYVSHDKIN